MAITSAPISVQAGRDYDTWITTLTKDLKDLIEEGAAPAFNGIDDFFELSDRLRLAVKNGAETAARSGQSTFTIDVPFTDAEQRMLSDMGASLLSYMEILAMRGKTDFAPNAGAQEAIAAMTPPEA